MMKEEKLYLSVLIEIRTEEINDELVRMDWDGYECCIYQDVVLLGMSPWGVNEVMENEIELNRFDAENEENWMLDELNCR